MFRMSAAGLYSWLILSIASLIPVYFNGILLLSKDKSAKIGLIAFPIVFNLVIHNSVLSEQGIL